MKYRLYPLLLCSTWKVKIHKAKEFYYFSFIQLTSALLFVPQSKQLTVV